MPEPTLDSTLADLETRLQACRGDGRLVLAGDRLPSQELHDLLASLGLDELVLERPTGATGDGPPIARTGSRIEVVGRTTLFGIEGIGATTTFSIADGALSVSLAVTLPESVKAELPIIRLGLGRFTATISVSGPSLDLPVVSCVIGASLDLDGHAIPVSLRPAARGWQLRAEHVPLPDFTTLGKLIGRGDVASLIPPGLATLGGLEIAEFSFVFDPETFTVSSIFARVATQDPEHEWPIAPPVFRMKRVAFTLGVEFAGARVEDGDAGQDRSEPVITAGAIGTMELGSVDLPVFVTVDAGVWRVGVRSASGFPSLGETIGLVAKDQPGIAESLPSGVRELRLDSASFEAVIDGKTVQSIFFEARLADHWRIVGDAVQVERARLELHVDRVQGDVSGFFSGGLLLGDVEVPVLVEKPAKGEPWMLRLACSRRLDLGGVSSLAKITGGGDGKLPDLAGASLSLDDFTLRFDPATRSVTSIDLAAALRGKWSPPGLDEFDIRDATLAVKVVQPADPHPKVDAELRLTLDVASVAVPIRAGWQTGSTTGVR